LLKVGLTGGIAAGKSRVGEMFVALGAHLIQADAIAHQLMQPGEAVYQEVVQHFGAGILDPDGRINRARLAEAAFGDPPRIQELNRIVHPPVIRKHDEWMEEMGSRDPHAMAIVEAALVLEAGLVNHFDRIVVVTCHPEQRIERWAQRMEVDKEAARKEVARRMAAQLPDEEKIKVADYVIDNSGSLDATDEQVKSIYEKLKKQALGSG
jgi:dephospho-CoA kinase